MFFIFTVALKLKREELILLLVCACYLTDVLLDLFLCCYLFLSYVL